MGIEEAILKEVEEKSEKRGLEQGRKEEKLILALNAIKKGFDNETIHKLTGLPVEEIEKLRKKGLKGQS